MEEENEEEEKAAATAEFFVDPATVMQRHHSALGYQTNTGSDLFGHHLKAGAGGGLPEINVSSIGLTN